MICSFDAQEDELFSGLTLSSIHKNGLPVVLFYITAIIYTFIVTGIFSKCLEKAHVAPFSKAEEEDDTQLSSYFSSIDFNQDFRENNC